MQEKKVLTTVDLADIFSSMQPRKTRPILVEDKLHARIKVIAAKRREPIYKAIRKALESFCDAEESKR